jgi:uncharacterized protein
MVSHIAASINHTPLYLSNWAVLYMLQQKPMVVVAIVGPACKAWTQAMRQHYPIGILFVGTVGESSLPLLTNKKRMGHKTTIYVCHQGICQAPMHSVEEALAYLAQIS